MNWVRLDDGCYLNLNMAIASRVDISKIKKDTYEILIEDRFGLDHIHSHHKTREEAESTMFNLLGIK